MDINEIQVKKALGTWKPDQLLTNFAVAYYEEATLASKRIFPVLPVQLPAGKYFEFDKASLARNQVSKKPPYGTVSPAVFGLNEKTYTCEVWQILIGLDELMELPFDRVNSIFTLKRARTKTLIEQIAQAQELNFAQKFFNNNAWANVWTGNTTYNAAQKKFIKFNDSKCDPIQLFDNLSMEIRRSGRRRPNKLALGTEAFIALKNNPNVQERIKYSGSSINPAVANEQTLAQLFGLEQVIVLDATVNTAKPAAAENMSFVCDSKGALLLYAPSTPAIDEPSALYAFTWLISGNDYISIIETQGAPASHTTFLEGVIAYDLEKTSDELAVYLDSTC